MNFTYFKFLLKTSRPQFWLGSTAFFLIGASSVGLSGAPFWLGLLFCTLPAGLLINGVNDIFDRDSDAANPRKVREGSKLDDQKVTLISKSAAVVASASLAVCILTHQHLACGVLLLLIATWCAYSCPPLRTKGTPFIDSITNGVGMLLFLVFARALQAGNTTSLFNFSEVVWMLFFGVIAVHALQTLWDIECDSGANDRTIGTVLQVKGTLYFCLVIFSSLLVFFHSLHSALNCYLLVAVSLCIYMLWKPTQKVIYTSTWILLYSFPLLVLYFLMFDSQFINKML